MGWLDKLFGNEGSPTTSQVQAEPALAPFAGLEGIRFGRYNDSNKSYARAQKWIEADDHFKAKEYAASFAAFFEYITDEKEQNVVFRSDGDKFSFELIQGSKKISGECDGTRITAFAAIAEMAQPSNAVMRRMLELNFSLFYTRCALDDKNVLCMLFDSRVEMTPPMKLYLALREMAISADRQDDLLVMEFTSLRPVDTGHVQPIPAAEIDVKYHWFRQWIQETIDRVSKLNADAFSGAISYLYLSLLYRIDFLIVPEARLMADLEAVYHMYWNRKDEIAIVERNAMMKDGVIKLLDITREQFADGMYRSRATFGVAPAPPGDKLRENVQNANKDGDWYVDNKYPELALVINEYGMLYNQYAWSVPRIVTDLTLIYMAVLYPDYFQALGMKELLYDEKLHSLNRRLVIHAIDEAIERWRDKYVSLSWDHGRVDYGSLWGFASTFSEQVAGLNLELRR